jgi:site-specific DNA-methyltransferase (adenine-specific)
MTGEITPRVYYEDEAVTLYHGDCLDVLPLLDPVDHVITDPPYAILVVNTSKGASRGLGKAKRRNLGYNGVREEDRVVLSLMIAQLVRRWALVFCDAESLMLWRVSLEAGGLRHIRSGAWISPACTPQFSGDRPGTGWEACEIVHAKGRCRWNGGGNPAVWVINRPVNGTPEREAAQHPTPKPLALMSRIVADFTDQGETILDPFAGSGTTLVAAKLNGRKAIGIEKSEQYCAVAAKRLRETQPGRLFDKLPKAKPGSFSFSDAVDPHAEDRESRPRASEDLS